MTAKKIVYVGATLALAAFVLSAQQQAVPDYKNPALPIEQRVADLLPRMSLDEKVDQLRGGHRYHVLDDTGTLTQEQGEALLRKMWQNNFEIPPRQRAILDNGIQRYEMEKSRLGIPALLQGEALHGFMSFGSTSFPFLSASRVPGIREWWRKYLLPRPMKWRRPASTRPSRP